MDEIYLRCDKCEQFYNYVCDRHSLVALNADWLDADARFGLLAQQPYYDDVHEVRLKGRFKLNLKKPFWLIWMDPVSHLDGLETERAIESIAFYLCELVEIHESTDSEVNMLVKILDMKTVDEAAQFKQPELKWQTMLDTEAANKKYYHIENFSKYSLIRISVEGDLGMLVIVQKQDQKSMIVALHEWDFHLNVWYCYQQQLSRDQEIRYGIIH